MDDRTALFPAQFNSRWTDYDWEIIPPVRLPPALNLALDEVLTRQIGAGARKPTLRFWSWAAPNIVIGRFQSVSNEVHVERSAELGIEIVRRISGGGAVLNEPDGAITYSLYVPPAMVEGLTFPESYAFLDSWVVEALRDLGIDAWYEPLNDLTSTGGKIGGAAQARRYGGVLHHTTMAYDMAPGILTEVLRVGLEKLSDKGIRSAESRVGPLRQQTELPRDTIIAHLQQHFINLTGGQITGLTEDDLATAQELVESKFANDAWTFLLP